MKKKSMLILAPFAVVAFVWLGGEAVMHLWNWLLPGLFGWRLITFWQGLGLLVLCRILFGRLGGHGPERSGWRRDKCGRMTPEEREKFRQKVRASWGGVRAGTDESKEPA
jgi:hypothetical protein